MDIFNIKGFILQDSGNKTLDKSKIKSNRHIFKRFLLCSIESLWFSFLGVL